MYLKRTASGQDSTNKIHYPSYGTSKGTPHIAECQRQNRRLFTYL